jgi:hypothetical protein
MATLLFFVGSVNSVMVGTGKEKYPVMGNSPVLLHCKNILSFEVKKVNGNI